MGAGKGSSLCPGGKGAAGAAGCAAGTAGCAAAEAAANKAATIDEEWDYAHNVLAYCNRRDLGTTEHLPRVYECESPLSEQSHMPTNRNHADAVRLVTPAGFPIVLILGAALAFALGSTSPGSRAAASSPQPPDQQPTADGIAPEGRAQIEALLREKETRSPAERKIDSQLLYARRMQQGLPVAPGVQTLEVDLPYARRRSRDRGRQGERRPLTSWRGSTASAVKW